jgi:DNA-binding PadR family transcriptional regulator
MGVKMTRTTEDVLAVMLAEPTKRYYGLELTRAAGLKPGTIYPLLARLEEAGWLTSEVETIDPSAEGRRPRRYYELTGDGVREARAALAAALARPRFRPTLGEA